VNSLFYRGWFCRQVQAHRVYSNWFLLDWDRSQRDMEIWRNYQCPWAVGIGVWGANPGPLRTFSGVYLAG